MSPDIIQRLKASVYLALLRSYHLPKWHARSESIQFTDSDILKTSQLLNLGPTARKEWWPATADSLPPGDYLSTVIHTTSPGIESKATSIG